MGALGAAEQIGQVLGQCRTHTGGALDSVGELGRMGSGQRDHRNPRCLSLTRGRHTNGRVRIDEHAGRFEHVPHSGQSSVVVAARGAERRCDPTRVLIGLDTHPTSRTELRHLLGRGPAVAIVHLEQQTLEVGRHLNVHRRAERGHHTRRNHRLRIEEAREDVVGVGADDERIDLGAHLARDPAGEHVAEVAGGDAEAHRLTTQRINRGHVVHDLRHHTRPVDAVDRRQIEFGAESRVVEHGLHEVLAIVEGAVDGHGVHVGCIDRGHLLALHVAHTTLRIQDDDVDVVAPLHAIDGRRASVAAGGPHDHEPLTTLRENVIEQTAHQLQRHVLERESGAVEQLHDPLVGVDLHERHRGRMAERSVRLTAHREQRGRIDLVADVGLHHRVREFGVATEWQFGQRRILGGNVQTAVGRETGEQDIVEPEFGCLTTRGDVTHGRAQAPMTRRMVPTCCTTSRSRSSRTVA